MTNQTSPRILSIRQPWATPVAQGVKGVENRSWATRWRGLLIIHASVREDVSARSHALLRDYEHETLPRGAIVGTAQLVDCVRDHPSPWAQRGAWHWVLEDAHELIVPIPYRGALGLMPLHPATVAAVLRRCA